MILMEGGGRYNGKSPPLGLAAALPIMSK